MPDTIANSSHTPRTAHFADLHEVNQYTQWLLQNGYRQTGNWNLGQACNHLAQTIDFMCRGNRQFVPTPVAAILRLLFFHVPGMRGLLRRVRVNTFPALQQNDPVDDSEGRERLLRAVEQLRQPTEQRNPNPFFGQLTLPQWENFHAWHAERHLIFLKPLTDPDSGSSQRHSPAASSG